MFMAPPQIDFDHLRVALHLGDGTLGEQFAHVHHGDGGGKAAQKFHVVLNHQHRTEFSNALQQFAAAVAAAVGATLRVVQVMTRPARTVTADLSVESLAQRPSFFP